MKGLIKEGSGIMEPGEAGAMRDAGIVPAGQKVKHYEHAPYERLRQFAELIGLTEAVLLPEATLNEVQAVNEKLSEGAPSII